jgi:hypothetical protein
MEATPDVVNGVSGRQRMGRTSDDRDPSEIDAFSLALEGLALKAKAVGREFTREELARRMTHCQEAGVADPDEFERCVISDDVS